MMDHLEGEEGGGKEEEDYGRGRERWSVCVGKK